MAARDSKSFGSKSLIAVLFIVGCGGHFAGRYCTRRRLSGCTEFSCPRRDPLVLPIGSG